MLPNARFTSRSTYRPHWSAPLQLDQRLPLDLRLWMRQRPSAASAWASCENAAWMLAWRRLETTGADAGLERVAADVEVARQGGVPEGELADVVRSLWPKAPQTNPQRRR